MNQTIKRPLALIILDGWGFTYETRGNAIAAAHTPYYDAIRNEFPFTILEASGRAVGLNDSIPGNAEIGHINMGAGRVVKTDAVRIRESITDGSFFSNRVLTGALSSARANDQKVHFVGLVSDGDVHSSSDTLYSLLRAARNIGVKEVYVHAILDGRDVPQRTADVYLEALEVKMADIGLGRIASICGRHFGMDHSEHWERTARAFTMMVHAEGERASDPVSAVRSSFLRGITDEFIAPIVIEREPGVPVATIGNGDLVVFFNHRADTMRQLVRSIAVPELGESSSLIKPRIDAVCITEYDPDFRLKTMFPPLPREGDLGSVFSKADIHNYRISEPDRFAHVTMFFNGRRDGENPVEMHIQVPRSERMFDRESEPEMRSFKITDALTRVAKTDPQAVFIANFPAPGLLAETGNIDRTVEAVQYIDTCLGGIVDRMRQLGGVTLITSTHGNCESMLTIDGDVDRFATANPVPFHLIDHSNRSTKLRDGGTLSDVAPTVLGIIGIEAPSSMTGNDLRIM
ncbi:2,3-bisphosphoglycerate-independent phosphoglycerate mutase [Leptolyngbya sp. 7M]|uniref:2,3-bisphosphoglycerate-independent phosphoglycerate mutase n=1 Tax=Leptolyngbya sp. 7M TaxID=2812896 RepID=UPI001B8C1173|nr:2,3-bisphosphoglycerate-independent phosphoglycerate mutase [Leptolyngbya sp. 7M]QYO65955.1 2,3-bisphosphoglycerate-independent phosphoglycerate mutase [Leptolyngbya sp. 7M]